MTGHVNTRDHLSSSDAELFRVFMRCYGDLGVSAEKADIDGISSRQLRRYEKGPPSRIEDGSRIAMAAFAASQGETQFLHLVEEASNINDALDAHTPPIARQLDVVLARDMDAGMAGYLIGEIRGSYRDAALADLAAALRQAEENAAILSEERRGHREAILRIDENARVRAAAYKPTGVAPSPYSPAPQPRKKEKKQSA